MKANFGMHLPASRTPIDINLSSTLQLNTEININRLLLFSNDWYKLINKLRNKNSGHQINKKVSSSPLHLKEGSQSIESLSAQYRSHTDRWQLFDFRNEIVTTQIRLTNSDV